MPDIFFEDLEAGSVVTYGHQLVGRDDMVAFAKLYDPQPFHVDEAAAASSPVGRLIASGWYTCALQMQMLCEAWLLRSASLGGPGIDELRWLRPVVAGDVLSVRQTILDKRASRSRPEMGVIHLRLETLNASGEPVMQLTQSAMFGTRAAGGAPPPPSTRKPEPEGAPEQPPPGPDESAGSAFEDVVIGRDQDLGSFAFTQERVLEFGRRYDRQPFHVDEAAAAASPYGGLIASGWQTAGAWMRNLVAYRQALAEQDRREERQTLPFGVSPGFRDLRWLKPVRAGETIRFATRPIEKRPSASRPGWGLVTSHNTGVNAAGETVFEFTGSGFWTLREAGGAVRARREG